MSDEVTIKRSQIGKHTTHHKLSEGIPLVVDSLVIRYKKANRQTTLCFIIGVTHFQNSSYSICLKQISIAAPHFKAMTNWDTLSIALFDGRHYIGAITKFLSLPRELKCVSSMIVN